MVGAKRVLRYLRGCPDIPIKFRRGHWDLKCYCDASFAGSSERLQKRSSTGYIFILAGGVISAASTLQKLTAQSSVHAEIIAIMATAAREAIYVSARCTIGAWISMWKYSDSFGFDGSNEHSRKLHVSRPQQVHQHEILATSPEHQQRKHCAEVREE